MEKQRLKDIWQKILNLTRWKYTINHWKKSSYIETEYECLKTNGKYTILKVKLITGKPHQIRAHLASVRHPIIGDTKYGRADINEIFRKKCGVKYQLLHAWQLKFDEMPDD